MDSLTIAGWEKAAFWRERYETLQRKAEQSAAEIRLMADHDEQTIEGRCWMAIARQLDAAAREEHGK